MRQELLYYNKVSTSTLLNGLKAYYKFDGNANDSTGNYDGTLYNNPTYTTNGKINGCYSFNPIYSEHVRVSNFDIDTSVGYSWFMWIYPYFYTSSGVNSYLLRFKYDGNNNFGLLWLGSTYKSFYGQSANTNPTVSYTPTSMYQTWNHIGVVSDATNKSHKLYWNGQLKDTGYYNDFTNATSTLYLAVNSISTQYWNGRLDEIGFWERTLTSQEISELYNNGNGNSYPFY